MIFAKKYVPFYEIPDTACQCDFCDLPCLKVPGLAAGENDGAEAVDLYFPIPDDTGVYGVSLARAIAVCRTPDRTYAADVEIASFRQAVKWLARNSAALEIAASDELRPDARDVSFASYCERAMFEISDGNGDFQARNAEKGWTREQADMAYAFFEEIADRGEMLFKKKN